jgi:hypothetical protein
VESSRLRNNISEWVSENLIDPEDSKKIDFAVEVDASLSFDENVAMLQEKFPGAFRTGLNDRRNAPKQLIMPEWLISKVETNEKGCTFRPKALNVGESYYLVPNRFQGQSKARIVVRIVDVEKVEDPEKLSEEDVRRTGLRDKDELFYWFNKWYAKRYPPDGKSAIKFRNSFVIQDSA